MPHCVSTLRRVTMLENAESLSPTQSLSLDWIRIRNLFWLTKSSLPTPQDSGPLMTTHQVAHNRRSINSLFVIIWRPWIGIRSLQLQHYHLRLQQRLPRDISKLTSC